MFLTNIALCDQHMQRLRRHSTVNVKTMTTFDWNDPGDRARYAAKAATTTAFFSFISGIVSGVRELEQRPAAIGIYRAVAGSSPPSCSPLAKTAGHPLFSRGTGSESRGDNDSFMVGGLVKRVRRLPIDGFSVAWLSITSDRVRRRGPAMSAGCSKNGIHVRLYLLFHKVEVEDRIDRALLQQFNALARRHYSDGLFQDFLRRYIVLVPNRWLRTLLWFNHRVKPLRRSPVACCRWPKAPSLRPAERGRELRRSKEQVS